MIQSIVFDIGNVLAHFNWRETYESLFSGTELDTITKITVGDSETWRELDRGTLSYEEILQRIIQKAPELEDKIRLGLDEIYKRIAPYPYAEAWVRELKARGLKLYVLSNYGKVPFEQSRPRFPFLELMDGSLISYEVQELKPEPKIFRLLCEKYGIKPTEAVFIDDMEENIKGAAALGFHTILFRDKAGADRQLEALCQG